MKLFFRCAFGEFEESKISKLAPLFELWIAGFSGWVPLEIPGTVLAKAHFHRKQLQQELQVMVDGF